MVIFAALLWLIAGQQSDTCEVIQTTISGNSMQGILWNGQKISVYTPPCGRPRRYDHMLFEHETRPNALVKQIWGMPGDMIRVTKKGRILINNDIEAKTPFGRPYVLVGYSKKRLRRLEGKPLEGYILLGHPGSEDSAQLGLITVDMVLGYVKRDQPYVETDQQKE